VYSTCMFCRGSLGRNEAIEHFQVGRRLAYDPEHGRLWVVCPRCERWNLTPLESRWEAIEEAERSYRQTRLRIATQNIGLARLNEGLELVRIGTPPRLELAGWRYGDQFGRRRRKYFAYAALGVLVPALPFLSQVITGAASIVVGTGTLAYLVTDARRLRRDMRTPTVFLTREDGTVMALAKRDTWTAQLMPGSSMQDWFLRVGYQPRTSSVASNGTPIQLQTHPEVFRGDSARRALAELLPHTNPTGGSARAVREAVAVMETHSTSDELINAAAHSRRIASIPSSASALTRLPTSMSLALEMVVHEGAEHRAMEGQLAELERRWREAEEIASIADELTVPQDIYARLDALRRAKQ